MTYFSFKKTFTLSRKCNKKYFFDTFLANFFRIRKKSSKFAALYRAALFARAYERKKEEQKDTMPKDIAFILYNTPEHSEKVQVVVREETLWMTQKAMSELFGVDKSSISRHLKNIFESGELDEKVVVAKIETTTQHGAIEGKTQTTESNFYNLDAIISVGYRVNSVQATRFRQ